MARRRHTRKKEFICTRCGQGTEAEGLICDTCLIQMGQAAQRDAAARRRRPLLCDYCDTPGDCEPSGKCLKDIMSRSPRRPNGFEERFRLAAQRVQNSRELKEPKPKTKPEPYQSVSSGITLERPKRAIRMEED